MVEIKNFEQKQLVDLLTLLERVFYKHEPESDVKEVLNVLNLSLRRQVELFETEPESSKIKAGIQEMQGALRDYANLHFEDSKNEISTVIHDFIELVDDFFKFVDKDTRAILDLCNVFRVVSDVYLRADRNNHKAKTEVRDGINLLVFSWLNGEVEAPSSKDELPEQF